MGVIPYRAKDGTVWLAAWGTVTKEADMKLTKNEKPRVSFSLNTGTKDARRFLNVVCYGNTDAAATAACLEKKDHVLCLGVWSRRTFEKRDGTMGVWEELAANFVIVQTRPEPYSTGPSEQIHELAEFVPDAPTELETDYVPSI